MNKALRSPGAFPNVIRRSTLTRDVTISLAAMMAVILLAIGLIGSFVIVNEIERQLTQQANDLADKLAEVMSAPLWNIDRTSIEQIAQAYEQSENVVALRVIDSVGKAIYETTTTERNLVTETRPVLYTGREIGQIEISLSRGALQTIRWLILGVVAATSAIVITGVVITTRVLLRRFVGRPISQLIEGINTIAGGNYRYRFSPFRQTDLNVIVEQINQMAAQIEERDRTLEQRVAERTTELEHKSRLLQASNEVSRAAASMLEATQLIQQVVELIRQHFELYYVGLFMVDDRQEWALLQAGTGEAGQAMLARGHRIEIGSGMIGWCIANAQSRVTLDVSEDVVRLRTLELPDTRSEAAIPLRSRGQVIGALTVQSTKPQAFDPSTVSVLQAMADQIAVAIDNAHLFEQAQDLIETERRAYGKISQQAWSERMRALTNLGFVRDRSGLKPTAEVHDDHMQRAFQKGQAIFDPAEPAIISLPIQVRGQTIGVVKTRKKGQGAWTDEEIRMIENMNEQLSVALDSARLYQETQRRAERERLVGEVTAQMRESLDVDTVLQTAVQQIRTALNLDSVKIVMSPEPAVKKDTDRLDQAKAKPRGTDRLASIKD
jgi:GAF domain-containing protein